MKKIHLLTVLLFCVTPFIANAKIWRVNNNPGIQADFTTPQAAHNAAAAGDTLHIEPSPINYGNLVLSKPLTIISIGNYLSGNPGLEAAAVTGTMQNLTVSAGASGSVLSCNFSGPTTITSCNNIRFERSYLTGDVTCVSADSIVILDCSCAGQIVLQTNSNNILITNSFIGYILNMQATCSAIVTNNILGLGGTTDRNVSVNVYNSIFENNILENGQNYIYTNSTVTNNITSGTASSLPNANNNQIGVNMVNVFVNPTGSNDDDFMLVNGSLATGAGVNGVDDGIFGGATPYKPGLQAAIPAIYKLTAPTTAVGNTLNIIFSTRSNN
jgi:hypothetical protein